MMTSKNGKMQPTPLLPLLDGGRLWILCWSWVARRSALSDPDGIRTRVTAVKGRYYLFISGYYGITYDCKQYLLRKMLRKHSRYRPGRTYVFSAGHPSALSKCPNCRPKGRLSKLEADLLERPWQSVRPGVEVKVLPQENELYVFAQSRDRLKKERAMRRRQLRALCKRLGQLQQMKLKARELLLKLGEAKSRYRKRPGA